VLSFSGVARRGQKLSIPISRFYASLDAYDLKLSLSSAGCSGVAVAPEEFIVQLDGVAGPRRRSITPTKRSSHGHPSRKPLPFSHSLTSS
jgi:hypothetical protein